VQSSLIFSHFSIWEHGTAQNVSPECPVYYINTLVHYLRFSLRRCLRRLCHFLVRIVLGTYNRSTTTTDEAELSQNLQTAFTNFIKDPECTSLAPNWPEYEADASVPTLAKIAYDGNVQSDNFVVPVDPSSTVSIGNIYTICGIFIGTPFTTNRMVHARHGTHSWTSAPEIYPSSVGYGERLRIITFFLSISTIP